MYIEGSFTHECQAAQELKIMKSYLVDLPIGAISNQFNQLKDTSWVLRKTERVRIQSLFAHINNNIHTKQ